MALQTFFPMTQESLKEQLDYDPVSGNFYWKVSKGNIVKGSKAGYLNTKSAGSKEGYISIRLFGTQYYAHRLAYLYMLGTFPEAEIDHIDGNHSNNSWENLRDATRSENTRNTKIRSDNTSGIKGVGKHKQTGLWRARVVIEGREIHLGLFATIKEAEQAVIAGRKLHHGQFHLQG